MSQKEKVLRWKHGVTPVLHWLQIARAEAKGLCNLMRDYMLSLWLCPTARSPEQVGIEGCCGAALPSVSSGSCGSGSRGVSLFNEKPFL